MAVLKDVPAAFFLGQEQCWAEGGIFAGGRFRRRQTCEKLAEAGRELRLLPGLLPASSKNFLIIRTCSGTKHISYASMAEHKGLPACFHDFL